MLLNGIILTCNTRFKDERTINAIFHLITGKRSIQTVQDAHLYGIQHFYGIYRSLSKQTFDDRIKFMRKEGLLIYVDGLENVYLPGVNNSQWLAERETELPYHYFNGLDYYNSDQTFIRRLMLYIQVLTNSKMKNYRYIPIIEDVSITTWMQSIYQEVKPKIAEQLSELYQELTIFLRMLPSIHAAIFVERLTSYQQYGMSVNQLADKYKYSIEDIDLILTGMTQYLLDGIYNKPSEYPLLLSLTNNLTTTISLTESAQYTYRLLQQQFSIQDIATKRRLKVNTVYDHIVEIALYDSTFSISSYVSESDQQIILKAIRQTKSTKLKHIKDHVSQHISYFQIRLVLTRANPQSIGDKIDANE